MNTNLLQKHIAAYRKHLQDDREKHAQDLEERRQRTEYYQSWTRDRLLKMTEEELYEYVSKLGLC